MNLNWTALVVTVGLVIICCVAMFTGNREATIGSLTALAGWLGGNQNGSKKA